MKVQAIFGAIFGKQRTWDDERDRDRNDYYRRGSTLIQNLFICRIESDKYYLNKENVMNGSTDTTMGEGEHDLQ